jgi:hypothetical protein
MTPSITGQGLLKLLSLMSVGLTVAAIMVWRETGSAPYLIKGAVATFAAAVLVGIIDPKTRPRVMFRFLAALFALIAIIALASDLSHRGSDGAVHFSATSLLGHIGDLSPTMLAALRANVVKYLGPVAWEPVAVSLLSLPTFVIFGLLAMAAGYAGRPRDEVRIFIN